MLSARTRYHAAVIARNEAAIVLEPRPYRERDLLLTVLGETHGVIRGVLRGARGKRHARGAASAQLLSLVTISWFQRPSAELATFTALELERSSFPLASDVSRSATAAAVAELLLTFCPAGEPAPRHFRLARGLLEALLGPAPPETVLAYALVWILRLGGVFPEPGVCGACGQPTGGRVRLEPGTGHPLCQACAPDGAASLAPAALAFLEASRNLGPDGELPVAPRGLLHWLQRLARQEAHRPLRALDVLEKLR